MNVSEELYTVVLLLSKGERGFPAFRELLVGVVDERGIINKVSSDNWELINLFVEPSEGPLFIKKNTKVLILQFYKHSMGLEFKLLLERGVSKFAYHIATAIGTFNLVFVQPTEWISIAFHLTAEIEEIVSEFESLIGKKVPKSMWGEKVEERELVGK